MHFLIEYGLFLAKVATLVVAILLVVAGIVALASKSKGKNRGKLVIKKLNEQFQETIQAIKQATLSKEQIKLEKKSKKKTKKNKHKKAKPRLFVLDFEGDIRATAVEQLRKMVTAVLLAATSKDEVLVRLESGGGVVHGYGLAAAQLQRLKDAKLHLTIAVDKIAASGGYMMACVADRIIAAPFAIIGSIGVIAQLPNFHRLLEKQSIDFEQITAGTYKRTLTMFGKNTEQGREKMQQEIDDTHALFKTFIGTQREQVDLDKVATGEHWFATQTIELKLVDHLQTSDDFLLTSRDKFDMFHIAYKTKKSLSKRLAESAKTCYYQLLSSNHTHGGQDYL